MSIMRLIYLSNNTDYNHNIKLILYNFTFYYV